MCVVGCARVCVCLWLRVCSLVCACVCAAARVYGVCLCVSDRLCVWLLVWVRVCVRT